jgi:hypothetical protein
LSTKAAIKLTGSASYGKNVLEGGTIIELGEIICQGSWGRPCRIIDLETMELLHVKKLHEVELSEYIFYRALEYVLSMSPDELAKVKLVTLSEPGKGRSITKGRACLKVVLDVVNKICVWPLTKVQSTEAGVSKGHQAWSVFKSFFGRWKDICFEIDDTENVPMGEGFLKTTHWKEVYVLSTDYNSATDSYDHDIARVIGIPWLKRVGIPPVLIGIVNRTCWKPRIVEVSDPFNIFSDYGVHTDGVTTIKTARGVFMGDPLTKVLLTLLNQYSTLIPHYLIGNLGSICGADDNYHLFHTFRTAMGLNPDRFEEFSNLSG